MSPRDAGLAALLCGLSLAAGAQELKTEALVHFHDHQEAGAGCRESSAVGGLVDQACEFANPVEDLGGAARAVITGGHLAAFATASQSGGIGASGDVYVSATATVRDRVVIQPSAASGLSGQRAMMTVDVQLSGVLLNSTSLTPQIAVPAGSVAVSSVDLLLTLGGQIRRLYEEDLHRHYTDGMPGDLQIIAEHEAWLDGIFPVGTVFGSYTFDVPFTFGQGLDIGIALEASAGARGNALSTGLSIADASRSFAWGGIKQITYQGQAVDEYTVNSALGIDWTRSYVAPVPLPGTAWMLACGLALVGAVLRRSATRRQRLRPSWPGSPSHTARPCAAPGR